MNMIEPLRYGASELRAGYNKNLIYALGISIAAHLVVIALYLVLTRTDIGNIDSPTSLFRPPIVLDQGDYVVEKPVAQKSGPGGDAASSAGGSQGTGTPEIAGTPAVANPLDSVEGAFASMGHLPSALPMLGGDPASVIGGGAGNGAGDPLVPASNRSGMTPPDADLSPDEFIAVETAPTFDPSELARNVRYPELARRNHVQGTVTVRVLIDRNGRALKTIVDHSDHVMLDDAAREAVMTTAYTPAVQNKVPVPVWMQVPVVFRLQ